MGILMKMNRNRIIRGIARNCSPFLVSGYGSQSAYSQGQIDRAIEETACNSNYSDYAYVMFGKEEDFPTTSSESYSELCNEIGEVFLMVAAILMRKISFLIQAIMIHIMVMVAVTVEMAIKG